MFSRLSPQYGNVPVLSSSESLQKRSLFGSLGNGAVLCIQRSGTPEPGSLHYVNVCVYCVSLLLVRQLAERRGNSWPSV